MKIEELALPDEMVEEMNKLFEVVDTDKSGSIEKGEIEHLMRLLGINAKDEELDVYFKTMDAVKLIYYEENIFYLNKYYVDDECISGQRS